MTPSRRQNLIGFAFSTLAKWKTWLSKRFNKTFNFTPLKSRWSWGDKTSKGWFKNPTNANCWERVWKVNCPSSLSNLSKQGNFHFVTSQGALTILERNDSFDIVGGKSCFRNELSFQRLENFNYVQCQIIFFLLTLQVAMTTNDFSTCLSPDETN